MEEKGKEEKGYVGKGIKRGRKIDFLGYQFTREATYLRKSIKKTFARKAATVKDKKKRQQVLGSYYGWCKWGDCRNLWNTIIGKEMSFAERGLKSQTKTKDGKRFFDDPEKRMMDILNAPITVIDFETGVKTRNGTDRYAIRFKMQEGNETRTYKVITNSFTLKSILDQARAYDKHLEELRSTRKPLSEEDQRILQLNRPMLPQDTKVKRRDLGNGKYDYYFE